MEIHFLQILFQIINFGVVFGAVSFLLYKPIIKSLDERRAKTLEAQVVAQEIAKDKEEIEAQKKKARIQSEKEASKLIEKAQEQAKELRATLTKQAKEDVKEMKEKEMQKVSEQLKQEESERKSQITEFAIAIAQKVVGTDIDKKTHISLINQSIQELESALK